MEAFVLLYLWAPQCKILTFWSEFSRTTRWRRLERMRTCCFKMSRLRRESLLLSSLSQWKNIKNTGAEFSCSCVLRVQRAVDTGKKINSYLIFGKQFTAGSWTWEEFGQRGVQKFASQDLKELALRLSLLFVEIFSFLQSLSNNCWPLHCIFLMGYMNNVFWRGVLTPVQTCSDLYSMIVSCWTIS